MTNAFNPQDLAALYIAAHATRVPVAVGAHGADPQSVEDAYAVQSIVMRTLGATGGFKTGRPDPTGPNVMAPIPAATIRPSTAHYAAAEMRLYGIELEIAFRIDEDLPRPDEPDYDARLRAAVSAVPAIEMVDTRLADRDGISPLTKLSDNQSGFGLVVGQPVKDFTGLNFTNPEITFLVDGEQIGATAGQIPGDVDAFQVFKDFLNVVGNHCGGLEPGMYVTTGALSGLLWTKKNVTINGTVAGLGDVAVTIGDD